MASRAAQDVRQGCHQPTVSRGSTHSSRLWITRDPELMRVLCQPKGALVSTLQAARHTAALLHGNICAAYSHRLLMACFPDWATCPCRPAHRRRADRSC